MAAIAKSKPAIALSAIELVCRRSQGRLDRDPEDVGSNEIVDHVNEYLRSGNVPYAYDPQAGTLVPLNAKPVSIMADVPDHIVRRLTHTLWSPLRKLGSGGGGVVYLSVDRRLAETLQTAAAESMRTVGSQPADGSSKPLSGALESLIQNVLRTTRDRGGFAAIKVPHSEVTAADQRRLGREVEAMKSFQHPALIRLLDHDVGEPVEWFAVEYHERGVLDTLPNREKYRGKPVEILRDLLPIAEALGIIHDRSAVHRDVKPKNIFVADDGHLVLGDFGVVLPGPDATRLTNADPAHSRDWVPDWVQFGQERTYTPAVDVFSLAKVAHYLLDGENVMASQMPDKVRALWRTYAGAPGLGAMLSLLERCIVTHERDLAITDGGRLAREISDIVSEETMLQGHPEIVDMANGHVLPISLVVDIDRERFSVRIDDYYSVTIERDGGPRCQGLRWHGRLIGNHIFDSRWPVNARIYNTLERRIGRELWRHRR